MRRLIRVIQNLVAAAQPRVLAIRSDGEQARDRHGVQPADAVKVAWKGRRRCGGQITTEYFIIASVLALVTVIGASAFARVISPSTQTFIDSAAEAFAH